MKEGRADHRLIGEKFSYLQAEISYYTNSFIISNATSYSYIFL